MTNKITTISGLYAKFLLEQKFRNNSKRTLEYYEENLTRFFEWLGSDDILSLSTDKWKEYGVYLRDTATKRNGDKYSESSIQGFMRAIKAFYNFGIEQGVLDDNVIRQLKLPKAHNKEERILDDDEITALFKCIDCTVSFITANCKAGTPTKQRLPLNSDFTERKRFGRTLNLTSR